MSSSVRVDRDALVALLDRSGLSERELARHAGLGHATVNHLVTGRRKFCTEQTARAIAAGLQLRPELRGWLFSPVARAEDGRMEA